MGASTIADWHNFLAAVASAAAALTGLVFVAVSINLSRILELPGVPGRAAEAICQLFTALIVATTLLIPGQSLTVVGWEMVSIGILMWIVQTILQIRRIRVTNRQPRWWNLWKITLSQFATLPFCVAGLSLLAGFPGGLYWMAPAYFFSFASGLASAWVLLIEIMR